ncbi:hypothetical protein EDEG_01594 [Edhazardia aedis USNM 41457]|uniref:Homeobox domain-containing protein n=1 Tax=Edhazardia aedis (strain USNM 41457) TaxID=1003232 RepID=J9D9F0_EDHAE|nr:hypothetical protein EDEG_01594 [Edhazardia aedis USNM 41457]|eukprot:EJW04114.1 hypothetical protein EDEG_01594 [Edhazardia aedis USNM 41457]
MKMDKRDSYFESFQQTPEGLKNTYYNPFMVKHRRRTSKMQLRVLEKTFETNVRPDANLRKILGEQLGMTPRSVQVWFQNRRAKIKKRKNECEQRHPEKSRYSSTNISAINGDNCVNSIVNIGGSYSMNNNSVGSRMNDNHGYTEDGRAYNLSAESEYLYNNNIIQKNKISNGIIDWKEMNEQNDIEEWGQMDFISSYNKNNTISSIDNINMDNGMGINSVDNVYMENPMNTNNMGNYSSTINSYSNNINAFNSINSIPGNEYGNNLNANINNMYNQGFDDGKMKNDNNSIGMNNKQMNYISSNNIMYNGYASNIKNNDVSYNSSNFIRFDKRISGNTSSFKHHLNAQNRIIKSTINNFNADFTNSAYSSYEHVIGHKNSNSNNNIDTSNNISDTAGSINNESPQKIERCCSENADIRNTNKLALSTSLDQGLLNKLELNDHSNNKIDSKVNTRESINDINKDTYYSMISPKEKEDSNDYIISTTNENIQSNLNYNFKNIDDESHNDIFSKQYNILSNHNDNNHLFNSSPVMNASTRANNNSLYRNRFPMYNQNDKSKYSYNNGNSIEEVFFRNTFKNQNYTDFDKEFGKNRNNIICNEEDKNYYTFSIDNNSSINTNNIDIQNGNLNHDVYHINKIESRTDSFNNYSNIESLEYSNLNNEYHRRNANIFDTKEFAHPYKNNGNDTNRNVDDYLYTKDQSVNTNIDDDINVYFDNMNSNNIQLCNNNMVDQEYINTINTNSSIKKKQGKNNSTKNVIGKKSYEEEIDLLKLSNDILCDSNNLNNDSNINDFSNINSNTSDCASKENVQKIENYTQYFQNINNHNKLHETSNQSSNINKQIPFIENQSSLNNNNIYSTNITNNNIEESMKINTLNINNNNKTTIGNVYETVSLYSLENTDIHGSNEALDKLSTNSNVLINNNINVTDIKENNKYTSIQNLNNNFNGYKNDKNNS